MQNVNIPSESFSEGICHSAIGREGMKQKIDKLRDILNQYKIFMEFSSMIYLSIMSILVGVAANKITKEQLALTEKQLKAEFSPRFELTGSRSDPRIAMWMRNYQMRPFDFEDPFSSFSDELLTDYDFVHTFNGYEDWDNIIDYIDGNVDNLEEVAHIRKDFNNIINGLSNSSRFENTGKQISEVLIQPFVLCELYTKHNPTPISYFTITDFFGGFHPKYYNNIFILEYKSEEILYEAVHVFNQNIYNRNPDIGYNLQYNLFVKISYRDSLDNLISEFYEIETGNDLIKTSKDLDDILYGGPENTLPNDDLRTFIARGFSMSDLYDEDSRIYNVILNNDF